MLPPIPDSLLVARPPMPTSEDEKRALTQATRLQILEDDWDQVMEDWLKAHIKAELLEVWGPPDTSTNLLADLCRQYTTPGLYGKHPVVRHTDPAQQEAAEELVGAGGWIDQAGHWTKMQFVQYLTVGLGDFFLRLDIDEDRLTIRAVPPHNVYAQVRPDCPDRPVVLWELRNRYWEILDRWIWAWDQYDISDPENPSYHVVLAASFDTHRAGEVLDNVFLPDGPFVGSTYPYVSETTGPVLPFSLYRAIDSGKMWNTQDKMAVHRSTLQAALYETYAGHAALYATGSFVILENLHLPSESHKAADGSISVVYMPITPGAVVECASDVSKPGKVHEVGPGQNLGELSRFNIEYQLRGLSRWGLAPDDVTRTAANPSSAAALVVSNQGRREYGDKVEPIFRGAADIGMGDLWTIQLAAILVKAAGLGSPPETGYTVEYMSIPLSPAEKKARNEDLQWQMDSKLLSPLDAYKVLHEGATDDDALEAIAQAQADQRRIEMRLEEILAEEGIEDAEEVADGGRGSDGDGEPGDPGEAGEGEGGGGDPAEGSGDRPDQPPAGGAPDEGGERR